MNTDNFKYSEITSIIIKSFYEVYNTLGYGFLEKVYENARMPEIRKNDLECNRQFPIDVYYHDCQDGQYFTTYWWRKRS